MKWQDYYDKFYDWAESTQVNRISSLTEFGVFDEILEITENLDEKGASKLIRKALNQNVIFSAEQIVALSEYLEKELLSSLIKSCKEAFTPEQLSHIEDYTMLYGHELQALITTSLNFNNLTWELYYNIFHELSDSDKIHGANAIRDFSANDEVIEIMFYLAEIEGGENFIFNAFDNGVVLSIPNIEELIELDNKKLNRRLIFDNFERLQRADMLYEVDYFESYMYQVDFRKLKQKLGYTEPIYERTQKVGFMSKLGAGLVGAKFLNHIFGDKDKK